MMKNKTVEAILVTFVITITSTGLSAQHVGNPQNSQPATQDQSTDRDFGSWDDNSDGYIDNTEFEAGVGDQGNYNLYDSNSDGMIDDAEWRTAQEHHDYLENDFYSSWDADQDGHLNRNEFNEGAYDRWDSNHDGQIDNAEYDNNYADWVPY